MRTRVRNLTLVSGPPVSTCDRELPFFTHSGHKTFLTPHNVRRNATQRLNASSICNSHAKHPIDLRSTSWRQKRGFCGRKSIKSIGLIACPVAMVCDQRRPFCLKMLPKNIIDSAKRHRAQRHAYALTLHSPFASCHDPSVL